MTAPIQTVAVPPQESEGCGYCVTLGMAYIPMQVWGNLYTPEDGFARGTIFEELDLPFVGKGDCRHD
ncbi:MAG: spore coat associated protein CotJA [Oscillospiraceae bacterium]|nr:spore coat associated protein CotJA [Oscillospiraceae bacterium]